MKGKKLLAAGLLLAAAAVGIMLFLNRFWVVDLKIYPKDARSLDLRDESISVSHYEKLRSKLPECDILWNVPFQDGLQASDTKELTVTGLTEADVDMLAYFPQLQTVYAEECRDYDQLMRIRELRPKIRLHYTVLVNEQTCAQDLTYLMVDAITEEELALLPCLTELETVTVFGGESTENLDSLQTYCHENNITFCVAVGNAAVDDTSEELEVEGVRDSELPLLRLLPQLKCLHLTNPAASAESLLQLQEQCPNTAITWEKELCGMLLSSGATEIDLSETRIPSLEELEQGMAYFPNAVSVYLGECGIDNEELAAYRERSREKYKVIWMVDLSGKLKVRTDIDNFMPSKDGWGYFKEGAIDNIRYCEDIVSMDLGHKGIRTVEFLAYMPNLEYLILAHTEVRYIDAISNCKKLKFLELDWSTVRDLTPLQGCTALEDLNIGNTGVNVDPLLEMPWLKNVWMIFRNGNDVWKVKQGLPNTNVVSYGTATVASGWRRLDNYYAMRDWLGMPYSTEYN